jgi:hypothetical protein
MELKIYKTRGRREEMNGDTNRVQSTEAWAPPKSVVEGELRVIPGQKNSCSSSENGSGLWKVSSGASL